MLIEPADGARAWRRSSRATGWCSTPPTGAVPEETEEGGRVFEVRRARQAIWSCDSATAPSTRAASAAGDLVWRTHDPEIDKAARPLPRRRRAVAQTAGRCAGDGAGGSNRSRRNGVSAYARLRRGHERRALSARDRRIGAPLRGANHALELLRAQFGRLGNTPYELADTGTASGGLAFAPASLLNQVRREAVERLEQAQAAAAPRSRSAGDWAVRASEWPAPPRSLAGRHRSCTCWCATPEQLEAALALGPASITLDYLDLYGLRPRSNACGAPGIAVRVASPRVLKPGEERIADFLLSCDCPILVRSAGLLDALRGTRARVRSDGRFQPECRQCSDRGGAVCDWASTRSRPRTI